MKEEVQGSHNMCKTKIGVYNLPRRKGTDKHPGFQATPLKDYIHEDKGKPTAFRESNPSSNVLNYWSAKGDLHVF